MKKFEKDLAAGIVLLLFSVFYFIKAGDIAVFGGSAEALISARTVPYLWAVICFMLAAALVIRSLVGISKLKAAGETRERRASLKEWFADNYAVVGTFIILALYAFCMRKAGYLLDTFVYLMIQIPLLTQKEKINRKLLLKALIVAAVFSVLTDYLFVELLNVPLPNGLLGF